MASKRVELIFENIIRGHEELRKLAETAAGLVDQTKKHTTASTEAADAHKKQGQAAQDTTAEYIRLAAAAATYAAAVKTMVIDSATYAARTQTLAVVTDQLSRVNNLSVDAVRAQVRAVREQGITTQESLATVNKMIFAQLDLAKATNLARLAQDAAVIAGVNSSEALSGIIHGIVTRQPEVLRTYGIMITFEQDYAKVARQLGRELTAVEKTQLALNTVLQQGAKITGSYETAMLTTGKQLTSLKRYTDEAKNAIGEGLVPALGTAVHWMTELAKYASENNEQFSRLASGITAVGTGLTVMSALRMLPLPPAVKLPVTAGAGILASMGAFAFLNTDPVEFYRDRGTEAISSFRRQRAEINRKLTASGVSTTEAETLRRQFASLEQYEGTVVDMVAEQMAKLAQQRSKGIMFGVGKEISKIGDLDLGFGVKVTSRDVWRAISRGEAGDVGGALFNKVGYDAALREEEQQQRAQKIKELQTKVDQILQGLKEQGLDPLQKLAADELEAIALLTKRGGSGGQFRDVRGAFSTRRWQMMNDVMAPIQAARAASTMAWLYGMGGPEAWYSSTNRSPLTGFPNYPAGAQVAEVDPQRTTTILDAVRQRALSTLQRQVAFQERILQLTAGPGGELAAIEKIAALREAAAQREFDLTSNSKNMTEKRAELDERIDQARKDRMLAILELQKRETEQARDMAGRVFDSLTARGGGGIRDFATGLMRVQERQLFVNLSENLFRNAGRILGGVIPGQRDSSGNLTWLGQMFKGTVFEQKDRIAMDTHTTAMLLHAQSLTGASAAAGASVAGSALAGLPGWQSIAAAAGPGGRGIGPQGFGGRGTYGLVTNGQFYNVPYGTPAGDYAVIRPDGTTDVISVSGDPRSRAQTIAAVAQRANYVVYAAYGVYSGIKTSGARGALSATGAGMQGVGSFLPPPAGPIVQGIGLGLQLASALIGNPKKKRAEQIEKMLTAAEFNEADPVSVEVDLFGRRIDYDVTGRMRQQPLIGVLNISAIDSKSIEDRYEVIANAVSRAAQSGHQMVPALREAIFPA